MYPAFVTERLAIEEGVQYRIKLLSSVSLATVVATQYFYRLIPIGLRTSSLWGLSCQLRRHCSAFTYKELVIIEIVSDSSRSSLRGQYVSEHPDLWRAGNKKPRTLTLGKS